MLKVISIMCLYRSSEALQLYSPLRYREISCLTWKLQFVLIWTLQKKVLAALLMPFSQFWKVSFYCINRLLFYSTRTELFTTHMSSQFITCKNWHYCHEKIYKYASIIKVVRKNTFTLLLQKSMDMSIK